MGKKSNIKIVLSSAGMVVVVALIFYPLVNLNFDAPFISQLLKAIVSGIAFSIIFHFRLILSKVRVGVDGVFVITLLIILINLICVYQSIYVLYVFYYLLWGFSLWLILLIAKSFYKIEIAGVFYFWAMLNSMSAFLSLDELTENYASIAWLLSAGFALISIKPNIKNIDIP